MSETQTVSVKSSLHPDKNIDQQPIERYLSIQNGITHVLAESNDISNTAARVLQIVCETDGWDFGALWMVEPETNRLANEAIWYADNDDLSEYADVIKSSILRENETSLPANILHSSELLWLSDLESFRSTNWGLPENARLSSGFILPIGSRGKLIAIIGCLTHEMRSKDEDLIEMLHVVGSQVGMFLERKVLEESLEIQVEQQHLLALIGTALSTSLDYGDRLKNFIHVIVPEMADWCAVDMIDHENVLSRVVAAHADPDKLHMVYALQPKQLIKFDPRDERPHVQALLSGQSLLFTEVTPALLKRAGIDAKRLEMVNQLNPKSSIIVPVMSNNRIQGLCTFVRTNAKRRFLSHDLVLAEEIGRRLAMALDNAILYAESQRANAELEHRVEERTSQLKLAINHLTNQITERQHAEEQVKTLNAELGNRIQERTFELEVANHNLRQEVLEHEKASLSLRKLLKRTRELYQISKSIGTVREPNEVLRILLSSSYLKNTSRASIAILEEPWLENSPAPKHGFILAEWNKGARRPKFLNQRLTLEELGVFFPVPFGQPIIIQDIQSVTSAPEAVLRRFASLGTHSLIILPLIAAGEWYGLLSLHFQTHWMTNLDDLRHVRGLVDETAIAIKNMRLLETEAKARREAETANELKLKFLAMISHELRTPLASIKGFATTLLSEDVAWDSEKQRDFLQTIDSEADKLTDLIEQLLDLSRIEAGTLRILPKKQVFQNILESALAQIHAVTSDHELVLDIPSDLPPIYADQQRIAQVLTNLVGNAAKFSPAHTQIVVSTHPVDDKLLQVNVSDQGMGIPAEKRGRIFEAFQQLENGLGPYNKGAGLGLAICKGLVEAHRGKIWIQERPGPGTTVSFTLPIVVERNKIEENSYS